MLRLFLFFLLNLSCFLEPTLHFSISLRFVFDIIAILFLYIFFRFLFCIPCFFFILNACVCVIYIFTTMYRIQLLIFILALISMHHHISPKYLIKDKNFRAVNNCIYAWIDTVSYRIYHWRDIRQVAERSPEAARGSFFCAEEGNCMWGRTLSPVAECYSISPSLVSCPSSLVACILHSISHKFPVVPRGNS